jgi:hypothetical protein
VIRYVVYPCRCRIFWKHFPPSYYTIEWHGVRNVIRAKAIYYRRSDCLKTFEYLIWALYFSVSLCLAVVWVVFSLKVW